jgi:nicotinamidase-related amidase
MRIGRDTSFLLIVDMQEKLVPVVEQPDRVVANAARLMTGAARLGVPILLTEHYPKGIGPTVPALRELAPAGAVLEKIHFDALSEPAFAEHLAALDRPQAVVAGTEAHVCVLQSALGLKQAGYRPYLVVDAVSSRRPEDKETAVARLRDAGVAAVTTEMVLFEWLARGDTTEFTDLLGLIKGDHLERPGEAADGWRAAKAEPLVRDDDST